jgi:hypothetical protein
LNKLTKGFNKSEIDLLIDFQFISNSRPDIMDIHRDISYFANWNKIIFAFGNIPKDLREFSLGRNILPRYDWIAWLNYYQTLNNKSIIPIFSDYTIQYGYYYEPPDYANFSASIRYTTENDWIIMRGEGVRNPDSAGYAQWPANASLLIDMPEFCGAKFSYGDNYIYTMATQSISNGNAETWLRAGINHHITFVNRQLANYLSL